MIFNDDEAIVSNFANIAITAGTTRPTLPGRVQLVIRNNDKAPLEENIQKVMLELTGKEESRSGLDLVVVLDVSNSMEGRELEELQKAMQFVIKKLSVVERLSIVKSNYGAERLCPLRQMTESTQTELQNLINDLFTKWDDMNITDGLLMALKILNDRSVSSGRVGAIMLISGGEENIGNAAAVPVGNVPVHTFGFGNLHDPKVLKAIANNSLGGTYSDVRVDNLTLAFSQCLGGLLSVVAQDLTVTISQIKDNSTIRQVSAGSYPQSMDNTAGSVTITFGDIYIQEIRKVLVDLHLPSTTKKQDTDVLEVSYTYKFNGELFEAKPETVTVCRMSRLTVEEQQALPKVRAEEVRLLIAEAINQAIDIFDGDVDADIYDADEDADIFDADDQDRKSAQDKLENGLLKLEDADIEELKAELRTELKELLKLLHTCAIFDVKFRPFAYSLLISLATQRQTARGNNIGKFQLFSTPSMQEFLEEAKKLLEISESFNDDEPVDQGSSRSEPKPIVPGKVRLEITSNDVAPLEENIQKVLLELSGEEDRQFGELDLVAVLDVSNSMEGDKLEKMKMAMLRLIDSARYNYRLSIVEYSSKAKRLCPLCLMNESFIGKLQNLIHDLECQPGTNITDGLEIALNVLKDRSVSSGRVGVIILMSDGEQNQGGDAADFPVGNVPVFTFGFGTDHPEVLMAIANNSGLGGTYTEVCMDKVCGLGWEDNLNLNFSHFFDELQRVVVWDVTVTVNQIKNESTVICASAGRYLQSIDNATGSLTITLGTLYKKEPHFVLVDILLPVTKADHNAHVLEVSYTYRSSFDGERCEARPATVTVRRMSDLTEEEQQPKFEVTGIEVRLLIAEMMKKATGVANKEDLKSLWDKLVHNLKSIMFMTSDILLEMVNLRDELEKLSELMQSQAINENQGHSSAYFLLISHYNQRSKERGNYLPVTPALREFLEEAMMYDDIDNLLLYMDRFICALQPIIMIIREFFCTFNGIA
ncbi:uncharacterized protein LOC144548397 [Carex rostrata]